MGRGGKGGIRAAGVNVRLKGGRRRERGETNSGGCAAANSHLACRGSIKGGRRFKQRMNKLLCKLCLVAICVSLLKEEKKRRKKQRRIQ